MSDTKRVATVVLYVDMIDGTPRIMRAAFVALMVDIKAPLPALITSGGAGPAVQIIDG